jgi:catalase
VLTAEQAIDRINAIFGAHPGCRALHAKGLTCRGSFTATPEAAEISRAAHLQGEPVGVVARLSNGSGDPGEHDAAPGVRGLAVGFELPGGERTDIVSQNQPRFPVSTPEAFMELVEAVDPGPKMVARLPWFLARHPRAARALIANSSSLKAPAAYGSIPYFAVHAYEFSDSAGTRRWGRYTWVPDPDEAARKPASGRSHDYLTDEVRARLPDVPIRFDLELQIAEDNDDPHDPASQWPGDRERVRLGELAIESVDDSISETIFDPLRLTDGIDPSDDPVLRFRPGAYSVSFERRSAA